MLIVFLGSPRSALVVAVSIPMALVSVFSLLNLTKVSANLLSLGAIDFGILVDGAIVVTEAILRRREAMPDEELSESEVKAAALQVTRPIFFASLIIITAYSAAVFLRAGGGQALYADGVHHGRMRCSARC